MARKYPSEFEGAIRLIGEMSRETDGRMKDILAATVRVFSRFANQAQNNNEIHFSDIPEFDSSTMRAHSWSKRDLVTVVPQALPEWKGCSTLSPTARLDQYDQSDYESTFNSYVECLKSDGKHNEVASDVLGYLKSQKNFFW